MPLSFDRRGNLHLDGPTRNNNDVVEAGGGQEDAMDSDFLSDEESEEATVVSHYVQVTVREQQLLHRRQNTRNRL